MNWSENDESAIPAEAQAPDAAQAPTNTLFMGDSGELPLDKAKAALTSGLLGVVFGALMFLGGMFIW